MRLYYNTTSNAAKKILTEGFQDSGSECINLIELTGVWLTEIMLNSNTDSAKKMLLAIDLNISEDELDEYEVKDDDVPYKEYLLPVAVINEKGLIQVVKDKADKELAYLEYLEGVLKEDS